MSAKLPELKPCPFCASVTPPIDLWSPFDAGHIAHMHCEKCGADGPSIYSETSASDAIQRARKAWGGRACALAAESLTSDERYWLERRAAIIQALADEGMEIWSDKGRVWIHRQHGIGGAAKE